MQMRGKKLEYWYGTLGFALPSHGPMETRERENHDGMGVRALAIPRASHRSDVFARAVLLIEGPDTVARKGGGILEEAINRSARATPA